MIFVSIGAPVNATLGARSVHRVTVLESDPPPVVSFVQKESQGDEGKGPAKIEVSLSEAGGKRATVEYAITGGTAENGKDFTLKNGTLVFEPGELSKDIDIGIIDDKLHEDNETIEVTLSNPVNAVLGKQTVHTYAIDRQRPQAHNDLHCAGTGDQGGHGKSNRIRKAFRRIRQGCVRAFYAERDGN